MTRPHTYFSKFKHANIPPAVWLAIDPFLERTPVTTSALDGHAGNIDIIGDIHGHYARLCHLLETLDWRWDGTTLTHPDPTRKLVLLGDLIDGGEDNIACLKFGHALTSQNKGIVMMGNHDWQFLAWIKNSLPFPPYNGTMDTLVEEWKTLSSPSQATLTQWLTTLGESITTPHPTLGAVEFVHGAPKDAVLGMQKWLRQHPDAARHATMFGLPEVNSHYQVRNVDWRPYHKGDRWTFFGHQPMKEITFEKKTVGVDVGQRNGLGAVRLTPETVEVVQIP